MTKNTLLNIAIIISRIVKVLFVITAIAITSLYIYVQLDNNLFAEKQIMISKPVISNNYFSYFISGSETYQGLEKGENPFTVSQIEALSLFIYYIKILIVLLLSFIALNSFEKIILSVKKLETFSLKNVKRFRKIGFCILILFFLEGYTVIRFEYGMQKAIAFNYSSLIYVLIIFIVAEIFKEGYALQQENELTI
ncbi:hypothetical protein FBALC1_01302 [Flavobacteriales bacterium ALC-1]|nr:hypothetical protein FBALC1_01302 [Flavobacteriales bacterium ALC-1]